MKTEIIIGMHSIVTAIKNSNRKHDKLFTSEESLKELRKKVGKEQLKDIPLEVLNPHQVQEWGKRYYLKNGFTYNRIPGNIFLVSFKLESFHSDWVYREIENGRIKKILAIDRVTDINNIGAIARTAVFYGVDAIIFSRKGAFDPTPSVYRIASGALEYIKVIQVPSLGKIITKLQELDVLCVGLSEHASDSVDTLISSKATAICLVLGAEDIGISNAVSRVIGKNFSMTSMGEIKSLNVSVASAIAMEKFWGK